MIIYLLIHLYEGLKKLFGKVVFFYQSYIYRFIMIRMHPVTGYLIVLLVFHSANFAYCQDYIPQLLDASDMIIVEEPSEYDFFIALDHEAIIYEITIPNKVMVQDNRVVEEPSTSYSSSLPELPTEVVITSNIHTPPNKILEEFYAKTGFIEDEKEFIVACRKYVINLIPDDMFAKSVPEARKDNSSLNIWLDSFQKNVVIKTEEDKDNFLAFYTTATLINIDHFDPLPEQHLVNIFKTVKQKTSHILFPVSK